MSAGRPSKFKPDMVEQARKLALLGATDREMADFFEVAESTFYLWKLEHPELSEALKVGKEAADGRVEQSLYRRALGYSHDAVKIIQVGGEVVNAPYVEHYPPDTTAAIFWLKNRRPAEWRDRQELTGADGKDLIPEANSETEIARRIAFALANGIKPQAH
jgi:hypothetical protein